MTGSIRESNYDSYTEYLDACKQRNIDNGMPPDAAEHDRQMMEANGEEYEGQYGGADGWGPG